MKRGPTAYARERRYVLQCVATMLEASLANADEWLYVDSDEFSVRRREKALKQLVAKLRKQADRGAPDAPRGGT